MGDLTRVFGQHAHPIRFDWGPAGARALAAEVSVVVDVLSFSTSVTVAVARGTRVYPYRWKDARASAFAASHDAVLAVGRLEATRGEGTIAPSLSPAALLTGDPVDRLVLPSPNGSTISTLLAEAGSQVALGCLRNAHAVAQWLGEVVDRGASVAVVAAGERWESDDTLRPALEDHLGAGAILAGLVATGHGESMSPEARSAADLYAAARPDLTARLHACAGGRELRHRGFAADVEVAADLDATTVVPLLRDGAFTAAP